MRSANGGPAFPVPGLQHDEDFNGMTLRDYFAAQALTTVAAYDSRDVDTWTPHDFAHHAYALADAMLAERAK
jgi:hypothetical protein